MLQINTELPMNQSNSHLGKSSNEKLHTLVNRGILRGAADFASTLSNVNKVEMLDLLEFLVMLLFLFP